jgi:ribose 5-phosphate isomerase B
MNAIAIGCDHAGFEYKELIKAHLLERSVDVLDKGTYSAESVDYPDFVHPVAKAVTNQEVQGGILICGTGNGVAMTANKYQDIRAGICWSKEIAELIRLHNDANVVCIPARFVSIHMMKDIVDTFIDTSFEGGRHKRRVDKICAC